jgi:OmpA-OmpF porin, OOP family
MSKQSLLALAVLALAAFIYYCVQSHAPMLAAQLGGATHNVIPPDAQLAPASLNTLLADGKVTLNGVMPDQATRDSVVAEAKKAFGGGNVIDLTSVSGHIAPAGWIGALPKTFGAVKSLAKGSLSFNHGDVNIKAELPTQEDKSALLQQITASVGSSLRVNDQITIAAAPTADVQNLLDGLLIDRVIEFETGDDTLTSKGKALLDEALPILREVKSPAIPTRAATLRLTRN